MYSQTWPFENNAIGHLRDNTLNLMTYYVRLHNKIHLELCATHLKMTTINFGRGTPIPQHWFVTCCLSELRSVSSWWFQPLCHRKQLVSLPTRGNNTLEQIYASLSKYYDGALILPPVGLSDHSSVLLQPSGVQPTKLQSTRIQRWDCKPANKRALFSSL